jgi:hypothetical protein
MPSHSENLRRWQELAHIDWFSHFIKAWIPFNAWMTNAFGELRDRELLDSVKGGSNAVANRIIPMLTWRESQVRGGAGGWQDSTPQADEFRLHIDSLTRVLQVCVVEGKHGRVSFETVDVGPNSTLDSSLRKWGRDFRVRRNHPTRGEITIEMSATASTSPFSHTQPEYNRRELEDLPTFQALKPDHRATILGIYDTVAPRRIMNLLLQPDAPDALRFGTYAFVNDPEKIFSGLVEVAYSLRNALFHGSITPNDQHNEIYEPAYHVVMRFVRCTI